MNTLVFHKPYGVLTGFTDPHTEQDAPPRPTLADYLKVPGIFPVGRLDLDSEGLLLLTDQPRISQALTAPGGHFKTYWVQLEGVPGEEALARFRRGVSVATLPAEIRLIDRPPVGERAVRFRRDIPTCWAEVRLNEGKNRQVRKMTAAIGHPTLRLIRAAIGPISLGNLAPGAQRPLTTGEKKWLAEL